MLIPLGTDHALRRAPLVTASLIAVTTAVFILQIFLDANPAAIAPIAPPVHAAPPPPATGWIDHLGALIPRWTGESVHGWSSGWWSYGTSALLHGGWLHLLANMLFLWVFGPPVEDKLGRPGFLLFYVAAAFASAAAHVALTHNPVIGASGAISGVAGVFLVCFPGTGVKVFSFLGFVGLLRVPAWWFIAAKIIWDVFAQASGGFSIGDSRTAHLAHLSGYLAGVATAAALLATRLIPREEYDLVSLFRRWRRRREFRAAADARQRRIDHSVGAPPSSASSPQRARGRRSPPPAGHRRPLFGFMKPPAESATTPTSPAQPPAAAGEAEQLSLARSAIVRLLAEQRHSEAAAAYRALADAWAHRPAAVTLARGPQLDLANGFYSAGDNAAAAFAYERFLDQYPSDAESPSVKVMLGRLYARRLNDPVRAKALLSEALPALRDDALLVIARDELAALG